MYGLITKANRLFTLHWKLYFSWEFTPGLVKVAILQFQWLLNQSTVIQWLLAIRCVMDKTRTRLMAVVKCLFWNSLEPNVRPWDSDPERTDRVDGTRLTQMDRRPITSCGKAGKAFEYLACVPCVLFSGWFGFGSISVVYSQQSQVQLARGPLTERDHVLYLLPVIVVWHVCWLKMCWLVAGRKRRWGR